MSTTFERIVLGTVTALVLIFATGAVHAAHAEKPRPAVSIHTTDSTVSAARSATPD